MDWELTDYRACPVVAEPADGCRSVTMSLSVSIPIEWHLPVPRIPKATLYQQGRKGEYDDPENVDCVLY